MPTILTNQGILFPDGTHQISSSSDAMAFSQTFTSSGSWSAPDGVTRAQITMIAGGGNGDSGRFYSSGGTNFYQGGGGGGSGAVILTYRVTVTPLTAYTVTVGGPAQASSFGNLLTANPGISSVTGYGGNGGDALSFPVGTTHIASYSGQSGQIGTTIQNTPTGAKGGRGGTTNYFNILGGAGGANYNVVGAAGYTNGGSGGGGGGYGAVGGAGGSGIVIVQW